MMDVMIDAENKPYIYNQLELKRMALNKLSSIYKITH